MNNPKEYIKFKLKERELTFESLAQKIDINRTKLFRLLQPDTILPINIRDSICEILDFTDDEKDQFKELLTNNSVIDFNNNTTDPWVKLVLNQTNSANILPYVTSYENGIPIEKKIEEFIHELHVNNMGRFRIYLQECFYNNLLDKLLDVITGINGSKLHHFIKLNDDNLDISTNKLNTIMKLSISDKYRPYNTTDSQEINSDIIFIECENKFIYGEIRLQKLHYYISSDINTFGFWKNKFQTIWPKYNTIIEKSGLITPLKLDTQEDILVSLRFSLETSQFFWNLEGNYQHMLFKENMCYDSIPQYIYSNIFESMFKNLYLKISESNLLLFGDLLGVLDLRYRHKLTSKKFNSIDFYTYNGIKSFLLDGKLSDYMTNLYEIPKPDCRTILQNLHAKSQDISFKMYLSNQSFNENYSISCYRGYGFIIEHKKKINNNIRFNVLKLESLSDSMWQHMSDIKNIEKAGFCAVNDELFQNLNFENI